jgi:hypothetical protein
VREGKSVLGRDRNVGVIRQAGVWGGCDERAGESVLIGDKPTRTGWRAGTYARAPMGLRSRTGRRPVMPDVHRSMLVHAGHRVGMALRGSGRVRARQGVVHGARMQRHRFGYQCGEPGHENCGEDSMHLPSVHGSKLCAEHQRARPILQIGLGRPHAYERTGGKQTADAATPAIDD